MPTSSGRVWLSAGLTDRQTKSSSSSSLIFGSQSSSSSQQGPAAAGRLQHAAGSAQSGSKWGAWTGSALQPTSGLEASSPTTSRVLHSSGLFTKAAKVTTTPFDSVCGSGLSTPAAGRRSTSVPRSPACTVFDAAWTPAQPAVPSRTSSHAAGITGSASSAASQPRSSSTGRSSRIHSMHSGPTSGAKGTGSSSSSSSSSRVVGNSGVGAHASHRIAAAGTGSFAAAVPGRACVVGGRGLPCSNMNADTLGPPVGLGPSKSSSCSTGRIQSEGDGPAGIGSTSLSSRSLQRVSSSGSSAAAALHSSQPSLFEKLPAAGSSWGPVTSDTAARHMQATGGLHVQQSQQPTASTSTSSYLVRLHSHRAATAGAASSSYSLAGAPAGVGTGSVDAVAGRRVSSANAAAGTSSSMQQALEKLRAGRMRPRVPTHDGTMAAPQRRAADDVPQLMCVALPGSASNARTHAPAVVEGSMGLGHSSKQDAQLQRVVQQPSQDGDSALACLTAWLEQHKTEKQQAAATADRHPSDQEVVPGQQQQRQQQPPVQQQQHPPVQQPPEQQGRLVAPVALTRRATDGGCCGPGERLEFPVVTQQPQQQDASSHGSCSKSGSYLDVIRSNSSSAARGRPLQQQQVSTQPAEQPLLRQQQRYHVQQYQPLLQHHSNVLLPASAATQRHGVHASSSSSMYDVRYSNSSGASTAQVYKPPYVPPQAATAVVSQDMSSSAQTHQALAAAGQAIPAAAAAVVSAGGFSRQQSGSSWSAAGSEAAGPDRQHSHSGSPAQQHPLQPAGSRTGRPIQQSSASSTQHGFLISTQPLAEHSSTVDATPAAAVGVGDAAWLSQLATDTGVDQQAAAARRAFIDCSSSSSSSECLEQSDSRQAAARAAAYSRGNSSSSRQRPSSCQREQQSAADNRSAVGMRRMLGRADSSEHGVSNSIVAAAAVAAGATSDSESDVSEMSSSLSSGSECSVEVAVRPRSQRPQSPEQQQQEALYGDDTTTSSLCSPAYARRSSLVGSPAGVAAGSASPAAANQVPVKAMAHSLSARVGGLPRGCCGIRNQGNTCYQNSALQLLGCVPELVGVLLGPQAVQLFQEAAAGAARQHGRRSRVTRALAAAAAAAQEGIDWRRGAAVGPALQALVGEVWGFQQATQASRLQRGSPSQTVQRSLQHQQQLQRVTQCMAALRCAMAESDPRWDDGDQWDCQEFCLALLQTVHTDSNRVRGKPQYRELKLVGCEAQQAAEAAAYARSWEDSVVLDIFSWQLQSTMTCRACGKASHAFDSAQELLVAIPPGSDTVTVQECLARTTFSPEHMVGAEGYKCESCKGLREATKQLQLFSYPQVLLLGLKRFETRGGSKGGNRAAAETYSSRKVTTRVRLDAAELLDLSPFCNSAGLKAAAAAGRPPPQYELIAVADHTGYIHGGHYTARGRALLDGSWMQFNDSLVLATEAPAGSTREGYMMLYRLVD